MPLDGASPSGRRQLEPVAAASSVGSLARRYDGLESILVGGIGVHVGVLGEGMGLGDRITPTPERSPAVSVAMGMDAATGVAMWMGVAERAHRRGSDRRRATAPAR